MNKIIEEYEKISEEIRPFVKNNLIGNLCNIINVLMMRDEVQEIIISDFELEKMTRINNGKQLSFEVENGQMVVTIGEWESVAAPGCIEINEILK